MGPYGRETARSQNRTLFGVSGSLARTARGQANRSMRDPLMLLHRRCADRYRVLASWNHQRLCLLLVKPFVTRRWVDLTFYSRCQGAQIPSAKGRLARFFSHRRCGVERGDTVNRCATRTSTGANHPISDGKCVAYRIAFTPSTVIRRVPHHSYQNPTNELHNLSRNRVRPCPH
jgi:hypothetical protein